MKQIFLANIKKDKMYDYLKQNSFYIKDLNRNPLLYTHFKEYIKDKYHLRLTDKVEGIINDIETVSDIMKVIK